MKRTLLQKIVITALLMLHARTHTLPLEDTSDKHELFVALDGNDLTEIKRIVSTNPSDIHVCYKGQTALQYCLHAESNERSRYYNRYGKYYWYEHYRSDKNNIFTYLLAQDCSTRGLLTSVVLSGSLAELQILLSSGKQLYPDNDEKKSSLLHIVHSLCKTLHAPHFNETKETDPTTQALEKTLKSFIKSLIKSHPSEKDIEKVAYIAQLLACALPTKESLYKKISSEDAYLLSLMPRAWLRYKALAEEFKKWSWRTDMNALYGCCSGYDMTIALVVRNTEQYTALFEKLIDNPGNEYTTMLLILIDHALGKKKWRGSWEKPYIDNIQNWDEIQLWEPYIDEILAIKKNLEDKKTQRAIQWLQVLTQPQKDLYFTFS